MHTNYRTEAGFLNPLFTKDANLCIESGRFPEPIHSVLVKKPRVVYVKIRQLKLSVKSVYSNLNHRTEHSTQTLTVALFLGNYENMHDHVTQKVTDLKEFNFNMCR